jgi:hypothetical protein
VPPERLTMGRGWRHAQRESSDVTERVVLEAQERAEGRQAEDHRLERQPASDEALLGDSLGLDLLGSIGEQGAPLLGAWKLALERFPERSAGECLTLAERALRALLDAKLIALVGDSEGRDRLGEGEVDRALRTPESWSGKQGPGCVWILRS